MSAAIKPCGTRVWVAYEVGFEESPVLGIFSTIEAAKAACEAAMQRADSVFSVEGEVVAMKIDEGEQGEAWYKRSESQEWEEWERLH